MGRSRGPGKRYGISREEFGCAWKKAVANRPPGAGQIVREESGGIEFKSSASGFAWYALRLLFC